MQKQLSENIINPLEQKAGDAALESARLDRLGRLEKQLKLDGKISSAEFNRRLNLSKRNWRHGQTDTKTYHCWRSMMQRCFDPNVRAYPRYGGRGITVCKSWHSFLDFFRDMGVCPQNMSLDRINNDGNYEPLNCRWATAAQQSRNSSFNVKLTFNGETLCVTDWAKKLGVPFSRLFWRIEQGWPIEKIISSKTFYCGGVDSPHSKLTVQDVRDIRSSTLSLSKLSKKYHTHKSHIWHIKRGHTYKNVT